MQSKAATVTEYLEELPEDRREVISTVRALVKKHLPKGFEEQMGYGMITWSVPLKRYKPGYHCTPNTPLPFASLASQKNHFALYLMSASYPAVQRRLVDGFARAGKKLDAGKACIRFRKLTDLPLDTIAEAVATCSANDYVTYYEDSRKLTEARKAAKKVSG